MKFGYIPAWSSLPWGHYGDMTNETPLNNQVMMWDAATSKWGPSYGAGGGDVIGPASNTANAVTLFDGTTGKLLKDDSDFTYNSITDTLFVQNITKSAVSGTDMAITGVSGGDVNITGYSAASGPGSVSLASGDAPTSGLNGSQLLLETSDTVNGSIKIIGGDRNSTTFTQKNEIYIRSTSNSDSGYITVKAASADLYSGADVKFTGGAGSSTDPGGSLYIQQIGTTGASGSDVTFTSTAGGTGNGGNANLIGGSSTDAGGGDITVTAGSLRNNTGNNGGDAVLTSGGYGSSSTGCTMTMTGGTLTDGGSLTIANGHLTSNLPVRESQIKLDGPTSSLAGGTSILGGSYASGNGTDIEFIAGDATLAEPGSIIIGTGGANNGTKTGTINITSGNGPVDGANAGPGGAITIQTGSGSPYSGNYVYMYTGTVFGLHPSSGVQTGGIYVTSGDGSTRGGNIRIASGDGSTTGGDVYIKAFTATSTTGELKMVVGTKNYFWPTISIPSAGQAFGIVSSSLGINVGLGFFTPDADMIFYGNGTLICRWDNSQTVAGAGLTASGVAAVSGTLGSSNDIYLRLTANTTGQNGQIYIDGSGVSG